MASRGGEGDDDAEDVEAHAAEVDGRRLAVRLCALVRINCLRVTIIYSFEVSCLAISRRPIAPYERPRAQAQAKGMELNSKGVFSEKQGFASEAVRVLKAG